MIYYAITAEYLAMGNISFPNANEKRLERFFFNIQNRENTVYVEGLCVKILDKMKYHSIFKTTRI